MAAFGSGGTGPPFHGGGTGSRKASVSFLVRGDANGHVADGLANGSERCCDCQPVAPDGQSEALPSMALSPGRRRSFRLWITCLEITVELRIERLTADEGCEIHPGADGVMVLLEYLNDSLGTGGLQVDPSRSGGN